MKTPKIKKFPQEMTEKERKEMIKMAEKEIKEWQRFKKDWQIILKRKI